MRKLLSTILLAMMAATTWAFTEIDGISYNLNTDDNTAQVTPNPNYTGDITIPATITSEGVTYTVTSIAPAAFNYSIGLTSVTIPNTVTSIGEHAFQGCKELKTVNIPNSITTIEPYTFVSCNITTLIIPSSVTTISEGAFFGCPNLKTIDIPYTVTTIGKYAFYACDNLTNVIDYASTPQEISSDVFSDYSNMTLNVPFGCIDAYKAADCWKDFSVIDEGIANMSVLKERLAAAALVENPTEGLLNVIAYATEVYDNYITQSLSDIDAAVAALNDAILKEPLAKKVAEANKVANPSDALAAAIAAAVDVIDTADATQALVDGALADLEAAMQVSTAINAAALNTARTYKVIENGKVVIIRNGKRFNTAGAILE